ncbi:hypothetical protein [Nocardia sp. X0981]
MTCDDALHRPHPAGTTPAELPPAPRSWPHIAVRDRPPGGPRLPTVRRTPQWPRRTGGPAAGCRGRAVGAERADRDEVPRRRSTDLYRARMHTAAGRGTGQPGGTGSHRRESRIESAMAPPGPGADHPAGPSDIERRARRYDRRMARGTRRARIPSSAAEALPAYPDRWSQRIAPVRTTRFPAIPPNSPPLPGAVPTRPGPERRYRRSPERNPIRRTETEEHRARPAAASRHLRRARVPRRADMLISAALTTVFIAFPLGPGTTAAAYTGGPAVLARTEAAPPDPGPGARVGSPVPTHPSRTHEAANRSPRGTQPASPAVAIPAAGTAKTAADIAGTPEGMMSDGAETPSGDTAVGAPETTVTGITVSGPEIAVSPPLSPTTAGETAARRLPAAGCGTGSGSGSASGSASLSACRLIPLLGDLVRALIRFTPRPATPCMCHDREP